MAQSPGLCGKGLSSKWRCGEAVGLCGMFLGYWGVSFEGTLGALFTWLKTKEVHYDTYS